MSIEENKALIRRWFEEGHHGNLSVVDELLAEDSVLVRHGHKPQEQKYTPEDHKNGLQKYQRAWPDARFEIVDIVAEGEAVAVAVEFSGTHTGRFSDEEPTNRNMRMVMHVFYRIKDGKIVWQSFDSGTRRYIRDILNGTLFKEEETAGSR